MVERALREDGLTHEQREELKRDLERIRSWFEQRVRRQRHARRGGLRAVGRRTCSTSTGCARPIRSEVDDRRLAVHRAAHRRCRAATATACCSSTARSRASWPAAPTACARWSSIVDDVHRWHDQGGWSQSRYQRGIQKETKDHLKHAGDELFKLFKRGLVQRLIIGTPEEMRGEVEHTLHSYLRERIAGWLDIDVQAQPGRGRARGGRRSSSATSASASASGSTG